MKKYVNYLLFYAVFGLFGGIYYRELTKFNDFINLRTTLGFVHPHLIALGVVGMILFIYLIREFKIDKAKNFKLYFNLYNVGLCVTALAMMTRGTLEVLRVSFSRLVDMTITSVAGLAHITLALGLVMIILCFKKQVSE